MKTIIKAVLIALAAASPVFGAETPGSSNSLLLSLFICFAGLIVLFQLTPALTMLVSMLKGLYEVAAPKSATAERESKTS